MLQGAIISCAGSYLYLWTVNGQLLASVNTTCSPESRIVCCCFAEVMDWDTRSIIITGSTDGVVRVGRWGRGRGILIHRRPDEKFCMLNGGRELLKARATSLTGQKLKIRVKCLLPINFYPLEWRILCHSGRDLKMCFSFWCGFESKNNIAHRKYV